MLTVSYLLHDVPGIPCRAEARGLSPCGMAWHVSRRLLTATVGPLSLIFNPLSSSSWSVWRLFCRFSRQGAGVRGGCSSTRVGGRGRVGRVSVLWPGLSCSRGGSEIRGGPGLGSAGRVGRVSPRGGGGPRPGGGRGGVGCAQR